MSELLVPFASAMFGALLASFYWMTRFESRITRVETKLDMALQLRGVDPSQIGLFVPPSSTTIPVKRY